MYTTWIIFIDIMTLHFIDGKPTSCIDYRNSVYNHIYIISYDANFLLYTTVPVSISSFLFHHFNIARNIDICISIISYIYHHTLYLYHDLGSLYMLISIPLIYAFGKHLEYNDSMNASLCVHALMHYVLLLQIMTILNVY